MRTGIAAVTGVTLLAALAGVSSTAAAPASAHPFRPFNEDGGNWSGYVASGSGFSSVTATWTEPDVSCTSNSDLYAPWVGIDGSGSRSVEQTGVQTDCSSGSPVNSPWYEMYPQNPVYWSDTVRAGDTITAGVSRSGTSYTLTLSDKTRGWTEHTTQSYNGKNVSAEVILESPSSSYPNFGTIGFSGATIDGSALSAAHPSALDANSSAGTEDHTSAIGSGGESFSVNYLQE
ncbi:MAG TPA: G1 family glutamic endopeptidase [Pseudonocardiaceae bacterium]|jgi:hypothetical protein|nr:G1 family glutamic endopeptidase [Pseudonocardiaceae bacterium]